MKTSKFSFWVDIRKIRPKNYWRSIKLTTSSTEVNRRLEAQFRTFVKKKLENCIEIIELQSKINQIREEAKEAVSKFILEEEDLLRMIPEIQDKVYNEWKNNPEIIDHLRLEFKKEKALKVLKRSIKK